MMHTTRTILAALAAAFMLPAAAQTLYKLIDKNGKVTYSEEQPKSFDGQVIRIDIDPNANRATLPKPQAPAKADPAADLKRARIREATTRVDIARRSLQEARDSPAEEDKMLVGNKAGGTRSVTTDAYEEKLRKLERAVKEAEEELKRVE
jgi:hypothetical protein